MRSQKKRSERSGRDKMTDIRKIGASNIRNGRPGSPQIVLPASILEQVGAEIGDSMSISIECIVSKELIQRRMNEEKHLEELASEMKDPQEARRHAAKQEAFLELIGALQSAVVLKKVIVV